MLTEQHILNKDLQNQLNQFHLPDSTIFFDIETTGLDHRRSHLYLIGCILRQKEQWTFLQFFADRPREEKKLLEAFSHLLNQDSLLIHFNGNTFDLPYLEKKCSYYEIPVSWPHSDGLDLFTKIRPLKKLLRLEHCRQKDCEQFCGIERKDPYTGKELIQTYRDYLETKDQTLYKALILHNQEDVMGMLAILPMLTYDSLVHGSFTITNCRLNIAQSLLTCEIELPGKLPKDFSLEYEHISFQTIENRGLLSIPILKGSLKHFYENYKDYFYLPDEDEAIHRSVGIYVDKNHRKPAKASNCYTKKDGLFLPQFSHLSCPVFQKNFKDSIFYFAFDPSTFEKQSDFLQIYVTHLMKHITSNL